MLLRFPFYLDDDFYAHNQAKVLVTILQWNERNKSVGEVGKKSVSLCGKIFGLILIFIPKIV